MSPTKESLLKVLKRKKLTVLEKEVEEGITTLEECIRKPGKNRRYGRMVF
jgi:hypothetical protein